MEEFFFETFWANSSGGFEGPETFFEKKKFTSISLHFPFHLFSSLLFHPVLSLLLSCSFSLLFRPVSSLVLLILSSCLLSSLLSIFSCLVSSSLFFSCLLFSFLVLSLFLCLSLSLSVSLCLSLFLSVSVSVSLCLCLRVVLCVVLCCVLCCVVCVVWCVARLGTQKTPPCVDSKRPRVYRHHAHMCYHMRAWCRYTRGRFESTHGDVVHR